MYMDNRQPLFNRFLSAAGGDSLELEQSQFMSIIEAAGLMGAQDASLTDELTVKETRQAFAASQQRDATPPGLDAKLDPLANERPLVKRIHRDLHALVQDFRESL